MSGDKKKLLENFVSLLITQGGSYIVPLITLPYLVGVLGVSNYGKISYALVFNQYFVILTAFGFNLSAPKIIAENVDDVEKKNEVFSSVLTTKIALCLFSLPILVGAVMLVPSLKEIQVLVFLTFGFVLAQAITPNWFFQGIEKMRFITLTTLGAKVVYAIALFVWVKDSDDILLVPIFNALSYIITAVVALVFCLRSFSLKFYVPDGKVLLFYMKDSFSFFLSRISVSLYTISNTFVIGTFGGMEMAGIYAIAEKLFQAMQGVYHPLVNAMYPFITRVKNVMFFKKVLILSIIMNVLFVLIIYLASDYIFEMLFKDAGKESIRIFKALLWVSLIIVPSILLGYPFLAAMGYPKFTNQSVVMSSFVHIIFLIFLVVLDKVNLINVVLAIFLTELIVLGVRVYGTFKFSLWKR